MYFRSIDKLKVTGHGLLIHEFAYSLIYTSVSVQLPQGGSNDTGGVLLESPMRTAMHGKSRVSSAVSVELN